MVPRGTHYKSRGTDTDTADRLTFSYRRSRPAIRSQPPQGLSARLADSGFLTRQYRGADETIFLLLRNPPEINTGYCLA
jgi:hypothetical protein